MGPRVFVTSILAGILCSASAALAQDSRTIALARELTALLDQQKLDSAAAREIGSTDRFVAALYFPGSQLLVVSARYAAPALLNEKVLLHRYKEAYMDLSAASDPSTKVLIEDLRADGIRALRASNEPFDVYTRGSAGSFAFDGDWKKRKLSEEEYRKTFGEADTEYVRMLESLIAQLKGAS
jgi:hypothetical protein